MAVMMNRMMSVLHAVVHEYVSTGIPVGSRTIVSNHGLKVSPATVRADLSRLEKTGHLTQPHVSAGRIPTDLGYRTAIDDDLASGAVSPVLELDLNTLSVYEGMRQIALALASLTHCLSIVSDPFSQAATIIRIALARMRGNNAMLVIMCDDGRVERRMLSCVGMDDDALSRAESVLTSLFVGKDVSEADLIAYSIDATVDEFVARVAQEARRAVTRASEATRQAAGVSLLLAQPEFRDSELMRVFVSAFEDDDIDYDQLLGASRNGLVVSIGSENPDERMQGISFVAKEYEVSSGIGFVACIGPTRMDYRTAIGAVEAGAAKVADLIDGGGDS
ncbi:MAG: heat-inducible transcription repressor HrcA [Atopobiaceae bacterium]|nr:heat-inducible transcription repressor HrcA [Atopobiaceae bacterium]